MLKSKDLLFADIQCSRGILGKSRSLDCARSSKTDDLGSPEMTILVVEQKLNVD